MVSASRVYCTKCGTANPSHAKFCASCGNSFRTPSSRRAAKSLSDTLLQNHMLKGRYRILGKIGKGGFGDVYRAVDTEFADRTVAIKEMRQRGLSVEEVASATEAFKREALLLAGLSHPNLPSIYDYFTESGRWYLVMNFIEGEPLLRYLDQMPGGFLSVETVIKIALQLCSVLAYLHSRQPPIIFRDLKPSNIMRTPQGQIYLIDFGIARHFKIGQTSDTVALGSPGYAAPEQYGNAQTTPQSDIYNLGATLHHLLSGFDPSRSPFNYAPLSSPVPKELNTLIMRMLEINPAKRPPSVAAVQQELLRISADYSQGLLAGDQPKRATTSFSLVSIPLRFAGSPGGQQQISTQGASSMPGPKVSRRAVVGGLAGLVVGGGLVSCLVSQWVGSNNKVDAVKNHVHVKGSFKASDLFPSFLSLQSLLAVGWSPDGKRIACGRADGIVQVIEMSSKKVLVSYEEHSSSISALAWSPDGKQIASASYDTTVRLWNAETGQSVRTYSKHTGPVLSLTWSPDGEQIVSGDYSHGVHVWNADSGEDVTTYANHTAQVAGLTWSPDGKYIASASADKTVQVWVSDSGETVYTYTAHTQPLQSVAWSPDGRYLASTGSDKRVQVWNPLTGNLRAQYHHNSQVWSLAWSPQSDYLASGSLDKTVGIWSMGARKQVYTYKEHTNYVLSVSWSSDRKHIVSSDAEGRWRVWEPKIE